VGYGLSFFVQAKLTGVVRNVLQGVAGGRAHDNVCQLIAWVNPFLGTID
jgi:hypothetical protein